MTREAPQGPTWRQARRGSFEPERAFVSCRCGVDMEFLWPRGSEAVRCFGCGGSFPRPAHLPPVQVHAWNPEAARERGRLARLGSHLRAHALLLALVSFAGSLLGLGLGLILGR